MIRHSSGDSPVPPPLFLTLKQGDTEYLGIRTAPAKSGLHKTLGNPEHLRGVKYVRGKCEDWRGNGTREHSDFLYLSFSFDKLPEKMLLHPFSDVFGYSSGFALKMLKLLFRAVDASGLKWDFSAGAALLSGAFYDDEQGIYLLSPTAAEILHQEMDNSYIPSGISGEKEFSYMVLRKLFLCLRNDSDKQDEDFPEEDEFVVLHPHLPIPTLRKEIAEIFSSALLEENPPDISELRTHLDQWEGTGLTEDISPLHRTQRREKAEKISRRVARRRQEKDFRKKYGTKILLTLAVVGVLLVFASPFIGNMFEEDATEGLPPEEVISLFYESQNSLDHEVMQDCTRNGAGKAQIDQVTTLFVITRIREGVERKAVFTGAPQWLEKGKPAITGGDFVFGVTELNITLLDEGENRLLFQAEYLRWTTLPPELPDSRDDVSAEDVESTGQVRTFRVTDELELEQSRKGWKIESLEERKRIPTD